MISQHWFPAPEPMLTQMYAVIWRHQDTIIILFDINITIKEVPICFTTAPTVPLLHPPWMHRSVSTHYSDAIMGEMSSQITSLTIVYSTVYSGVDQSKHQSSASLAFVWGIHRGPVNSPHKWPVTRKMFPFDDVIMYSGHDIPVYSGYLLRVLSFRWQWWIDWCIDVLNTNIYEMKISVMICNKWIHSDMFGDRLVKLELISLSNIIGGYWESESVVRKIDGG